MIEIVKIFLNNSQIDNPNINNSQNFTQLDDLFQRFYDMYIQMSKKYFLIFRN